MEKTLIIDGANLVYRTWWIAKQQNHNDTPMKGLHIHFTLSAINSYVKQFKPNKTIVVWDDNVDKEQNERKLECETYKANRTYNPEPHENNPTIRKLLDYLGIPSFFPRQLEGDDCIAYLCAKLPGKKVVVSADGDFLQLVSEFVSVYDPARKRHTEVSNFSERSDVPVDWFLTAKCITGDKSDNIAGIYRFGKKKLQKLIAGEYKLTEEEQSIVDKNMSLFRLDKYKDFPRECEYYDEQKTETPVKNSKAFFDECRQLELNSILNKQDEWLHNYFAKNTLSELFSKLYPKQV